MQDSFGNAFDFILLNEGGYSDHRNDRGGPTKYGITLKTLSSWRGTVQTADDVKNLSVDEAKQIYYKKYWLAAGCDKIDSDKIATALFDQGILNGVGTAVRLMQRALNRRIDGKLTVPDFVAINQTEPNKILAKFISAVQNHLIDIVSNDHSQMVFLRGWIRRSQRLLSLL